MLARRGRPASPLRHWRRSLPRLILCAWLLPGLLSQAAVADAAASGDTPISDSSIDDVSIDDTSAGTSAETHAETRYPLQVTDLAGRVVTLDHPPKRIFLDDPRHLLALAALLPDPVARLSGWHGSLADFDPEAQARFTSAFPALARLPVLQGGDPLPSAEALLTLAPDLVLVNLSRYGAISGTRLLTQLDALGIPVLFIDFQRHPLADTRPSLTLLGRALGVEPRAAALNRRLDGLEAAVDACVDAAAHDTDGDTARNTAKAPRPSVLIDIAPGLKVACCRSNFDSGLADLVARAGGDNIAAGMTPGSENVLNPEAILARDPAVIIATAAQWPAGGSVRAGFGVTPAQTQRDLADVVSRRPGWATLSAVNQGGLHALWHGYHQSPFSALALTAIARWLHPQACAALDPEGAQRALFRDFLPIAADGTFRATYGESLPGR
ncbi:ABC transporter substrate-binding protein [Salinicola endophyticus]|uniref:ABC transporter substrate-binding protein n=1 Tax=Salinicola endophyticus TaxID=1949083 RepID=A0ABY8FL04_9GAMM|nr:ABC transporter substrate-binding protein [Salinicola endophyticus]WFF41306.1 ABC transporter substrate-binding protein [Salinicola endophyticus]